MVIDLDNGAKLERKGDAQVDVTELVHRTVSDMLYIPSRDLTPLQGTPKYIARSVSLGQVLRHASAFTATPMPELHGETKDLYIKAYGKDRYNKYAEEAPSIPPEFMDFAKNYPQVVVTSRGTIHGGGPPPRWSKYVNIAFTHRPEHDVESVWWTMMSTLVQVHPANRPQEDFVPSALKSLWKEFSEHAIFANSSSQDDSRGHIIERTIEDWLNVFEPFPEMVDLAHLLHDISCHVKSEYALWDPPPPHPDHLHEAVQRLILQYLVDHKDKDVKLTGDPTRLRPVDRKISPPDPKAVKADGTTPKTKIYTFVNEDPSGASTSQPPKRKSQSRNSGTPGAPKTKRRKGGNDDEAAAV